MKLRFEPALVQELVSAEALRDLAFRETVRAGLEPVYELPLEERAEKFAQAYVSLFHQRGLGAGVVEELARFPALAQLEQVLVFRAQRGQEEGAELSQDRRWAGLRLSSARLSRREPLGPFLRHELMHLSDMLDKAFAYQLQSLGENPAQEHLYRQRYGLLWDAYIDGRLERQGLEGEVRREERLLEWEHAFSFLPARPRRQGFRRLWHGEGITHPQLVAWAQEPWGLGGEGEEVGPETQDLAPLPGTSCPLCHFPTYAWGDTSPLIKLIQADFPSWEPKEGACLRCVELYQLRAGVW